MKRDSVTAYRGRHVAGLEGLTVVIGTSIEGGRDASGEVHWWLLKPEFLQGSRTLAFEVDAVAPERQRAFFERYLLKCAYYDIESRRPGSVRHAWDPQALKPWPVRTAVYALALHRRARTSLLVLEEESAFGELRDVLRQVRRAASRVDTGVDETARD